MSLENYKIRNLIKKLQNIKGDGTSMVTIAIKAGASISDTNKMLTDEFGTASNIKSRVNRQSVLSAITSAQQVLKKFNRTPTNGLIVYSGEGYDPITNKEKKFHYGFEPFKPLITSYYRCDSCFHTHFLEEMIVDHETFGYIIIDGKETLYATLNGNDKRILNRFSINLPKKHNKGGQSSVRFARLREEAVHNYITKVTELANQTFIQKDQVIVKGLILAGSADMKNSIEKHNKLDYRLVDKIISKIDIAYGGTNGLDQAIHDSINVLSSFKLKEETEIIKEFFELLVTDDKKTLFGINTIMSNLEGGSIEKIIMYQDLEMYRVEDEEGKISYQKEIPETSFKEIQPLNEFLMDNVEKYGIELKIVSDSTSEGSQLVNGFGGLVGILRYSIDLDVIEELEEEDEEEFI